jgi:hypothetical protein
MITFKIWTLKPKPKKFIRSWNIHTLYRTSKLMPSHRISIPAYAVEQQWWQLGVSKNEMSLMSFIFKMMLVLYQSLSISGSISNIYWHASKWSSISFSPWQCPSDSEFSFPRLVGLLILSLRVWISKIFNWLANILDGILKFIQLMYLLNEVNINIQNM